MKKRKNSVNIACFILAGVIAVVVPCAHAIADSISTSKRADSGLKSTGNVEYASPTGGTSRVAFAISDLYYLENRIEDELKVVCQ